jgi:outer membrane protein assembly factor BamB
LRINPSTDRIAAVVRLPDPSAVDEVVVGGGYAWVTNGRRGTLTKVDPQGRIVATYRTGAGAHEPSFSSAAVWVSNGDDGTLVRVDAKTGRQQQRFQFGHTLGTEAALGRYVLVAITPGSTQNR